MLHTVETGIVSSAPGGQAASLRVVPFSSLSGGTWDRFVASSQHGWIVDREDWLRFFERACGYAQLSFGIVESGMLRLVYPLFLVPNLLRGARLVSGPFFDHGGALVSCGWSHLLSLAHEHVLALGEAHDATAIEIRDPRAEVEGGRCRDEYCKFVITLGRPERELLGATCNSVRRAIRRALVHECTTVVSENPEDLRTVWRFYCMSMKRHGTPPWPTDFFEMFAREMRRGSAHAILALHRERVVGGAFLLGSGAEARLEVAASPTELGRRLQVSSLLYWRGITLANEMGHARLDLTRTLRGSSQYNFKKRWGGTETPMPYVYLGSGPPPLDPRRSWLGRFGVVARHVPSWAAQFASKPIRTRLAM